MKKKFLAAFLVMAMAVTVLAACGGTTTPPADNNTPVVNNTPAPAVNNPAPATNDPAPAPAPAGAKVYLITMDRMDQHWVAVDKGASDMAKALGLQYKWDAPEKKDNAVQIEALNNAVADGASLVLLAANDPVAISSAVADAKAKGVKVIYVDSPANEPAIATLSTNNYNAGKLAAETMLAELGSTSSGSIAIIGVNTATNSTMNRENGFREVIAADGRFTLLTTEYKDGEASASQDAADNFITANADLVGIFGTNEGSTVGAGNAIKAAAGKNIIGVGFDKSDAIQSLLNDGSLKAAMAQNPYTMGYLGMAQAYAAINNYSTGPATIDTGVAVLTKD